MRPLCPGSALGVGIMLNRLRKLAAGSVTFAKRTRCASLVWYSLHEKAGLLVCPGVVYDSLVVLSNGVMAGGNLG